VWWEDGARVVLISRVGGERSGWGRHGWVCRVGRGGGEPLGEVELGRPDLGGYWLVGWVWRVLCSGGKVRIVELDRRVVE
jgi:hypothetical protein